MYETDSRSNPNNAMVKNDCIPKSQKKKKKCLPIQDAIKVGTAIINKVTFLVHIINEPISQILRKKQKN